MSISIIVIDIFLISFVMLAHTAPCTVNMHELEQKCICHHRNGQTALDTLWSSLVQRMAIAKYLFIAQTPYAMNLNKFVSGLWFRIGFHRWSTSVAVIPLCIRMVSAINDNCVCVVCFFFCSRKKNIFILQIGLWLVGFINFLHQLWIGDNLTANDP